MNTEPTPLPRALADLATTMAHNPDRLRQVRQRVERRRRRRMVTGAAVSAGAVAATIGVAAIPRTSRSSLQSAVAPVVLPACSSVALPLPHVPTTLLGDKPAAASANAPDPVVRYKGSGIVNGIDGNTIIFGSVAGPGLLPPGDPLGVFVDETTTIENRGAPAVLADVAVGREVIFSISVTDAGQYHLDYIDVAGGARAVPADPQAAADKQAAANAGDVSVKEPGASIVRSPDGRLEGKGAIDSAPAADQLVVQGAIGNGDKTLVRLALSNDTRFFRHGTACTPDAAFVGAGVVFIAIDNGDGSYRAIEVRMYD